MTEPDFSQELLERASEQLKAMAHPARISILLILKNGEKLTVTQIHESLGIEQSTTSHHLGILKDKGVLCSKREGKNTFYYIKNNLIAQMVDSMRNCTCEE
ncbi:MAG TPA: metalloregulator ArsR/SmtB family transcription factor [Prolixibacteraceae bacterium]|nr:metalloregulator ArsR/SmtB family transcription factor [Prolixibacteraceae bacterium]